MTIYPNLAQEIVLVAFFVIVVVLLCQLHPDDGGS